MQNNKLKLLCRNLFGILNYKNCKLLYDEKQLINFIKFILSINNNIKSVCLGAKISRLNWIYTLLDVLAEKEISNHQENDDNKINDVNTFLDDNNNDDDDDEIIKK